MKIRNVCSIKITKTEIKINSNEIKKSRKQKLMKNTEVLKNKYYSQYQNN